MQGADMAEQAENVSAPLYWGQVYKSSARSKNFVHAA